MNLERLRSDLIAEEGYKRDLYWDSEGFISFGVGRNLEGNPLTREEREFGRANGFRSEAFIDYLLSNDIKSVLADLDKNFSWYKEMPEPVQLALAQMRFQFGSAGFRKFAPTLAAIKTQQFAYAGKRLRRTLWAKQTPNRARRVIKMIEDCEA